MIIPELLQQVLIALAIGGLIGVERGRLEERKFFGTRTSALLAMAGPLSVKISESVSSVWPVIIYIILGASIAIMILKIRMDFEEKDIGLTTSSSVFVLILSSLLVGFSYYFEAVAVAIITTFLLAGKERIRPYVSELTNKEILDALKVGAAAFIIYPLLPSEPVTYLNLVIPRKILLFILLVLGIRFVAFVASRQLSQSGGLPLTGLVGGGVSSLATSATLSKMSRGMDRLGPLYTSVLLATVAMVIRNVLIVSISSPSILSILILPMVLVALVGAVPLVSLLRNRQKPGNRSGYKEVKKVLESPLSLKPALKLGAYFLVITLVGNLLKGLVGQEGLLAVALVGGVVSSAAVAVSVISMLSSQSISLQLGSLMIVLSCISSIVVKIFLVRAVGTKKLFRKLLPFLVLMIIVILLPFLFL